VRSTRRAEVAIIGGSGFYDLEGITQSSSVETPWGEVPIDIGELAGRCVAFLARHGKGHAIPPHRVNSRAHLWALREVGVAHIVASFACGSLEPTWGPGTLVVPDQLIDRTRGRPDTFHDSFVDGPAHAPFADPYDPLVRAAALRAGESSGEVVLDGATVVVIEGPRFATRAESASYRMAGAQLINMTQYPETVLARELGIRYGAIGLVTDHDAGLQGRADVVPVNQELVFAEFARHLPRLRAIVAATVGALP
jgi:5'-methylthioadenosine phosphorylase